MEYSSLPNSPLALITIVFLLFSTLIIAEESISKSELAKEKKTRVQFYLHNILSGPTPTAVDVVRGPVQRPVLNFGDTVVIDDALTEGPNPNSKYVGRAQGFYMSTASQGDVALLMDMNIIFVGSKYNSSTLAVLARNPFLEDTRELSVVGGTGYFRLAQGYIICKTYMLNSTTRNSIHHYDVHVVHY